MTEQNKIDVEEKDTLASAGINVGETTTTYEPDSFERIKEKLKPIPRVDIKSNGASVSVYDPKNKMTVNTNLSDVNAIRFMEDVGLKSKSRADYFGMQPIYEKEDFSTMSKSFARSGIEMTQTLAQHFNRELLKREHLDKEGLQKAIDSGDIKTGEEWAKARKDFINYDEVERQMNIIKDNNNSFIKRLGLEATGNEGFMSDLFSGGASIVGAIGLTYATKNPLAVGTAFGLVQKESTITEMLSNNIDYQTAEKYSSIAGIVEGGLESVGLHLLFKGFKGNTVIKRVVNGFIVESIQEGSQTASEEIIMQTVGGREKEFLATLGDIGYSALIGGILGGGISSLAINSSKKLQKEFGLTKEQADELTNKIVEKSLSNQEVIDEASNILKRESSNLTYKDGDFNKSIQHFKETIEGNQKRFEEGQDIRDMVEKDLSTSDYAKELTSQAKADMTELLVNQAQMFAESGNRIGVSPREFYEANMATDVREGVIEGVTFDEEAGVMKDADGNELFQLPDNAYSEKGQVKTESPEFKNWFGDSVIRNGAHKPTPVYHGTRSSFDEFKKQNVNYAAYSKNFYFTKNINRAKDFGDTVMEVYLKAEHPINTKRSVSKEQVDVANIALEDNGYDTITGEQGSGTYTTGENFLNDLGVMTEQDYDFVLKAMGYDSIIADEEIVVFDPTQIKSVDNTGTFDPQDANIFYQGEKAPTGKYNPVSRIITMLFDSNVTTPFHERLGHHTLEQMRVMNDLYIEKTGDNWEVWNDLESWVGKVAPSGLTKKQHEKFADGYIKFLKEGKAPTGRLKAVFVRMSELFKDIYNKALNNNIELNESARTLYKTILTSPYANSVEYYQQLSDDVAKASKDIREGKYKDVSPDKLAELNELIEQANIKIPKEPQDFIQYVRERGGINLNTAKLLDLTKLGEFDKAVGYKGLFKSTSKNNENDLTEMMSEFTGQDAYEVESTEAVDFFIEALDEPVYRPEDLEVIKAIEDINRNREIILDTLGETKELKKELKRAKKYQDIGFTEVASAELVSKMVEIDKLRKDKRLDSLTREEIKAMQKEITNLIKALPISKEGQSQFLTTIKNVNTPIQFRNAYKNILNRATNIYGKEIRNKTAEAIDKKIKQMSENVVSGVRKGKYDYNTNKTFADLKRYNSMNKEDAFKEWEKLKKSGETASYIRTRFLTMKVLGKKDGSVELFKKVYSDLLALEKQGKEKTHLKDFIEKEQEISDIEKVKGIIKGVKPASKLAITFDLAMGNFKSLLNSLGGQKLSKMNLIRSQKNEEVSRFAKIEELNSIVRNAYDIKHNEVPFKMSENSHDNEYKLFYKDKTLGEVNLTKSNIISVYNLIKNPKIKEDYYNTFGELQVDSLINNLTSEDKAFGDGLTEFFEEYYTEMNEIFIELNGVDLGKPENYFPSSSEHQTYDDIFNDYVGQSNIPSSFKSKVKGTVIPNPKIDSYGIVVKYISQAERIKNVSREQQRLLKIFKDLGIKNIITNLYGAKVYQNLIKKLNSYGLEGIAKEHDSITGFFNRLLANWTGAKVGLNPSVASKQLISILNFSNGVNKKTFSKYLVEGMKTPKKTWKFMHEGSEYIGVREKRGGSDMITRMISNAEQDINKIDRKLQKLGYNEITVKNFISWTQRKGDITPFIFGGYAKVKYFMSEEGGSLSKKEAFEKMEDEGLETQQSGLSSMQSDLQNRGGYLKTLTQFKNAQHQYYAIMKNATQDYLRGEISKERLAEIYIIYGVVNPAIFGAIAYGFGSGLKHLGGDDDDDNILKEMGRAMATQVAGGVPLFGKVWEEAIRGMTKGYTFGGGTPVISDILGAMQGYGNNFDVDVAEVIEVLIEGGVGVPIQTPIRYSKKIGKIITQ